MSDKTAMDLRDFPYMPLYIARLQRSKAWLMCKRDPALAFYMMNLWMRSWHEVPSGSIEDDDDILADAAMCDPKTWDKIKDKVLRGWERRDGRLFHVVVTSIAAVSYEAKDKQRRKTSAARNAATETRLRKRGGLNDRPSDGLSDRPSDGTVTVSKRREGKGKGEEKGEGEGEGGSLRSPGGDGTPQRLSPAKIAAEGARIWNEVCGDKLPKVQKITEARKENFLRRFKDDFQEDWDFWRDYCRRIAASSFLTNADGSNRADWCADFDFVLEPRNLVRIVEGKWDASNRSPPDPRMDALAAMYRVPPPNGSQQPTLDLTAEEWRTDL